MHSGRMSGPARLLVAILLLAGLTFASATQPGYAGEPATQVRLPAPPVMPSMPAPDRLPAEVRVQLAARAGGVSLSDGGGLMVTDSFGHVAAPAGHRVAIRPEGAGLEINGSHSALTTVKVSPAGAAPLQVFGRRYRGSVWVRLTGEGRLSVTNYAPLESYVAGVLGGEIPSSWPGEAQKAQAVAARTYAVRKILLRQAENFDVVGTDADQVYAGVAGESAAARAAVAATRGDILVHDGHLIVAYYHSNCGGSTEAGSEVFPGELSYLVPVKCPYCADAPRQFWTVALPASTIRGVLTKAGVAAGIILGLSAEAVDESGRVATFRVRTTNGNYLVRGADMRKMLGPRILRSTKCRVSVGRTHQAQIPAPGSTGELASRGTVTATVPATFVFQGAGWGHGVGLCQHGARGLAAQGAGYRQILAFYYPGVEIVHFPNE